MASSRKNKALALIAILAVSGLSACADYKNNWDESSFRAGNAHQANTAIQEIEPWPKEAYKTTVGHGG